MATKKRNTKRIHRNGFSPVAYAMLAQGKPIPKRVRDRFMTEGSLQVWSGKVDLGEDRKRRVEVRLFHRYSDLYSIQAGAELRIIPKDGADALESPASLEDFSRVMREIELGMAATLGLPSPTEFIQYAAKAAQSDASATEGRSGDPHGEAEDYEKAMRGYRKRSRKWSKKSSRRG